MGKAKHANIDAKVLEVYQRMVASVERVEVKGDALPYTSVNGNMFSSINKVNTIGVRLSEDARRQFMRDHDTTLFEALPGFFQKEYVAVPRSLHSDDRALAEVFRASYEYAKTLKPKPTTRRGSR